MFNTSSIFKSIPFFKKNKRKQNIKHVTFSELQESPQNELFDAIYNDSLDVLIIDNFISAAELSYFRSNFIEATKKYPELIDKKYSGYTFGKTLFDTKDLSVYKAMTPKYEAIQSEIFGFSMHDRLIELLKLITKNIPVTVAKHTDNKNYLSNSIRILEPEKDGIFVHADLHLHQTFNEASEITSLINNQAFLGLFLKLQNPEAGGNLFLYNVSYKETPEKVYKTDKNIFESIYKYVSNFERHIIHVDEGSLILFNAGQRWHAIEPIKGKKERITVGCFAGYTKSNDTIYIWT